ncbi:MAG: tRNA-intron lyase [Candidatus Aenigmarchaeota archaeon]|nr:tRNA-intron lyase [Candidatus Aenigmarchaeota archaeon]
MKGELNGKRVIVWDKKAEKLFEKTYCGRFNEDRLELSLVEAAWLFEKKKISVEDYTLTKFLSYCNKQDPRFDLRFIVYKDLRKRELPTRTGFKFGCDFRVYEKGANPLKRGSKEAKEHTKWVVFAVSKGYKFSYPELSRAARLAHNIRAKMIWGLVDKKNNVSYYSMRFFKP